MSYTPGPWSCIKGDGRIFSENGMVAMAMGAGYIPLEEIQGNVFLLTAAPQLLEACKALLAVLDQGDQPRKLYEALTWRQNDERAHQLATAAIAAAEPRP